MKEGSAGSLLADNGFARFALTHDGITRDVYRSGNGPAVTVMQEVPGLSPEVISYACRVRDRGFTVFVPHLFGSIGVSATLANGAASIARICMRREFALLAADRSSPMVDWLRALARQAREDCGAPGVGLVGFCLTGSFALAMTVDDAVRATVACEPSLPLPLTRGLRKSLHLSPDDLACIRQRVESGDAELLVMRFRGDPTSPGVRMRRLQQELGARTIELERRDARKGRSIPAHSPLTIHLIDERGQPTREALERSLEFLEERLTTVHTG